MNPIFQQIFSDHFRITTLPRELPKEPPKPEDVYKRRCRQCGDWFIPEGSEHTCQGCVNQFKYSP